MTLTEASLFAKKYSSVIFLNQIVPSFLRSILIILSFVSMFFVISFAVILTLEQHYGFLPPFFKVVLALLSPHQGLAVAILGIALLVFIFLYPLHLYSRFYSTRSIRRVFGNNNNRFRLTYEAGEVLLAAEDVGLVKGLLSTPSSTFILERLLLTKKDVEDHTVDIFIPLETEVPLYEDTVTLGSLWKLAYESSQDFQKELLSRKIQKEIYYDTCSWLDRVLEDKKRSNAWWWRENLSRIRGLGKTLSYGDATFISRYARELALERDTQEAGKVLLHKDAITSLEEALAKTRGANAVIVGGRGTGRHTVITMLSRMIERGDCYAEIEHKRLFEFDNTVLASLPDTEFISVFSRCFEEALISRNIVFVIRDTSELFDIGQKHGANIFQIMERFISHTEVSIICVCDQAFYQEGTHKMVFDKDFEVIHIGDISSAFLVPYIQDHATVVEKSTGKFFPAHSISLIASSLAKYFTEDSPLVKTSELMYKIATNNLNKEQVILDDEIIAETIKSLTGVSTGEIGEDEKEKLLNLEATLHQKVMGQNEALKMVASTMRRSRVGLVSGAKPIGSFLFLGPTGVGKTETAKTLAQVFFGSEDHMSRIDMNEYTMGDSSHRLLGDENEEGDLARLLHNRPYGVLLLDELEKSTTDVKDIFLRVLDEGVFTNGSGKVISARTQIVIATSNAGSNYIRESGLTQDSTKEEVEKIKSGLIESIIAEGLFRPEFINRFDAVVLFHPLGQNDRLLVAKKMLDALKERVLKQGYQVTFTDALVEKVLGGEGDVMYGGRAIQRNIQTDVEEAIAKKIIDGSLKVGDSIVLDAGDIG